MEKNNFELQVDLKSSSAAVSNLICYAKKYIHLYKQPKQNIFHTIVACVCSQQVSFQIGRNIRKQLYEEYGFPLTVEKIDNDIHSLNKPENLTYERQKLIIKICEICKSYDEPEDSHNEILEKISELKGIGKWTIDAVSILLGLSDTINLSSDAYVRKNLCFYHDKNMKIKDCHKFIAQAEDDQTKVCYFLWRLKWKSVGKVAKGMDLDESDFV